MSFSRFNGTSKFMEKIMKIPFKTVHTASLIKKKRYSLERPTNESHHNLQWSPSTFSIFSRQDTTAEAMEHKKADFASGLSVPKCRMPSTKTQGGNGVVLLMAEILHQLRLVVFPIIYRASYFPGGCLGFQPSTVGVVCTGISAKIATQVA